MIGSIIGDIVGSRFEFRNYTGGSFELFAKGCTYTDDTVMVCAVADLLMKNKQIRIKEVNEVLQSYGRRYPDAGYGRKFYKWVFSDNPLPYNSCGNGAAMRISPVGWFAKGMREVIDISYSVTSATHNHPEGIKGAAVTAMCIYMARNGCSKEEILDYAGRYYGDVKTCDEWKTENGGNHGKEICQVSVPQAIACFRQGENFEEVIRNCVYIGGDTDTIAAIAGGVAEAYYGIPDDIINEAFKYLPEPLADVVRDFRSQYCK